MLTKIQSVANVGLETVPVEVEVDVAEKGFPGFTIVGLASKAVEEARERVKTAINNSGFEFPNKKITVNLAPADLPKDGAAYDLPIAIGVLMASGQLPFDSFNKLRTQFAQGKESFDISKCYFYGELSLDGSLRPTRGILLLGLYAEKKVNSQIYVPAPSAAEATVVPNITVYPVTTLFELVEHFMGAAPIGPLPFEPIAESLESLIPDFDLKEIAGQEQAKRALIIAAAGGHNLLMYGPPGTGKSMLAKAMPGILPPLSAAEALEVTRVYSIAGMVAPGEAVVRKRPFRSPHHGVSAAGLIGGGSNPLPGEVSLAHLGVLFLDEMPEFPRGVLESLRQPMEDGVIEIVRAAGHVKYPASFTLIAAINPCPCGYLNHPKRECKCTEKQITKYRHRISGPILDRIDLTVQVAAVEIEKLQVTSNKLHDTITSRQAKDMVIRARKMQAKRFTPLRQACLPARQGSAGQGGFRIYTNSQMRNKEIKKLSLLTAEAENLLKVATEKYDFSARSYFRLIKVARTIADLEGSTDILPVHMAEALQYKQIV
jgi:magnesium chelatase family protein